MTVTVDAMGCQKEIAKTITEAEANCVRQVKGNQTILGENIAATFEDATRRRRPHEPKAEIERLADLAKGPGRAAQRVCSTSRDLSGIEKAADWAGLRGIAMMLRETYCTTTKKTTQEISYHIFSHGEATNAEQMSKYSRNHWAIESNHWSLDVTFGEI